MDEQLRRDLDRFFEAHEQKAYLMAVTLTHNRDDALELVQDSMLKLVQKYRNRDSAEWAPLFFRILQNSVTDWFRKQKFRQLLQGLAPWQSGSAEHNTASSAEHQVLLDDELQSVFTALQDLPLRQQQTFLMRAWQEFSTRETAYALSISENSVKTHYARATARLRQRLGDENEQ